MIRTLIIISIFVGLGVIVLFDDMDKTRQLNTIEAAVADLNNRQVATIYACGMVSGANGGDSAILDSCKAYRGAYDMEVKREH